MSTYQIVAGQAGVSLVIDTQGFDLTGYTLSLRIKDPNGKTWTGTGALVMGTPQLPSDTTHATYTTQLVDFAIAGAYTLWLVAAKGAMLFRSFPGSLQALEAD